MGKKSSLSEVKRAEIVTLYKEKYSQREIAVKAGVSKTAVRNAVVKYQHDGTFKDKKLYFIILLKSS